QGCQLLLNSRPLCDTTKKYRTSPTRCPNYRNITPKNRYGGAGRLYAILTSVLEAGKIITVDKLPTAWV
ncbi:MAG: hypothetical protein ABEI77_03480, partial [Halorientalis sp.]